MILRPDTYAHWRNSIIESTLNDGREEAPAEKLLHSIWQHQRLTRERMETVDGLPFTVLHPGFHNHSAGPDFLNTVVQWSNGSVITGDVEIDPCPADWRNHNHEHNPFYKDVILHVVWDTGRPFSHSIPTACLRPFLDAPLFELSFWLERHPVTPPSSVCGLCAPSFRILHPDTRRELLAQAALVRLESKARRIEARARQTGWTHALYEVMFRALGYKHNSWPMQRIAELIPTLQSTPLPGATETFHIHSRLLGISGLLPPELPRIESASDYYVRRIWDYWWKERHIFSETILPRSVWRLQGLRPANHPHRRLALASNWLSDSEWIGKLEKWFTNTQPKARNLPESLLEILQAPEDPFWRNHYSLFSRASQKPQPLLGRARTTDIAVNAVIPWFWIRAIRGDNRKLKAHAEELYFSWPQAEDNSLLRLARLRLLNNMPRRKLAGAAIQQGLLQILQDFCSRSNSICQGCRFHEGLQALAHRYPQTPDNQNDCKNRDTTRGYYRTHI
ncbi:MAG: DUF2851 family protein [Verrucomicrobia bacterium]|nr:DUF2851 family protein [Verrucomicrobiota bacterium]